MIGTTPDVLRKWEKTGELLPARKTRGGTRYYSTAALLTLDSSDSPTICYARVSSRDQKEDLHRQHQVLAVSYCAAKGWRTQVIRDLGSGMNYNKKGLRELLEMILRRNMKWLVLTHKDRHLRFGADLVFARCDMQGNLDIVIIYQGERPSFEEKLAQDVLEIITVFSARLYGARSHKETRKTIEALTEGTQRLSAQANRDGLERWHSSDRR